jgi:16S rRNA (guanine966-N2)-methyltransferase
MSRIIAGSHKGHRLLSPKHHLRPTTDLVKEHIFNVTQVPLNGLILDLFAGTGSLGLESLSRGAAEARFVDNNRRSLDLIRRNGEKLALLSRMQCFLKNALTFLKDDESSYDLILADPPYQLAIPTAFFLLVWKRLASAGRFVFEYSSAFSFPVTEEAELLKYRKFGETGVWTFEKK